MGYVEDLRADLGQRPLILSGAVVIIGNPKGKILLQERRELRRRWGLPGGLMELGELPEETAKREVSEETGLEVMGLKLLGVYSQRELSKAENGDLWQNITMCYYTSDFSGEFALNENEKESIQFKWFALDEIPENFVEYYKQMIEDYKKVVANV
ncbi:MAG: NUDIX domain-containing protein [Streptococcaceae bacterium]|jgi:ADP-ribose pyrophosphatase YjhB (NUDIX family)|nr:NUDIX domain-containing protein [Streptococcaceae bacterium]